jgi:hypothetical protein
VNPITGPTISESEYAVGWLNADALTCMAGGTMRPETFIEAPVTEMFVEKQLADAAGHTVNLHSVFAGVMLVFDGTERENAPLEFIKPEKEVFGLNGVPL